MSVQDIVKLVKDDPSAFCRLFFNFEPYQYQKDFWDAARTMKRMVLLWGRGAGKTTAVAIYIIYWAFTHPGDAAFPAKTLVASASLSQAKELFDTTAALIENSPILMASVQQRRDGRGVWLTRTEIRLTNNHWIRVIPTGHNGRTIRGKHPGLLILDEAAHIKSDIIEGVVFPMLNIKLPDGSSKTLIMLSTPWGGITHPFRKSFMDPDYWKLKIRSTDCPNIDQGWLEKQKANNPYLYKIENDVDFPDEESAWLRQELLLRISDDYGLIPEKAVKEGVVDTGPQYRHFVGVDLGKVESYTVISVFREEIWKDGRTVYRLVYLKKFPRLLDIPKEFQKDYDVYVEAELHLKKVVEKFHVVWVGIDLGAAGEAIIEHVKQFYPKAEGISLSEPKKRDVASWMRLLMEQGRARIPVHPDTISTELNSEQHVERENGMIHFYPAGDDKIHSPDDQFWSIGLALYGTKPVEQLHPPFGAVNV